MIDVEKLKAEVRNRLVGEADNAASYDDDEAVVSISDSMGAIWPAILALAEREKRMREAFQDFSDALENSDFANAAHELNSQMCCTGYACGCRGSTVGEYLAHELRETARRALGEEKAS